MPTLVDGIRGDEQLTDAECRRCRYPLRGLQSDVCPECGRRFNRYDPWTIWLPGQPNRLAQWLVRRPTFVGRTFPFLGALAVASATRVPGFDDPGFDVAFILYAACALTMLVWYTMIVSLRRRGYSERRPKRNLRRFKRQIGVSLLVSAALIIFRPTLYASFWISRPWLDPVANGILAQPFSHSTPYLGDMRGLYYLGDTRRCPHGVKLNVGYDLDRFGYRSYQGDHAPGFFYAENSRECSRFHLGRALGGGWYVAD